MISGYLKLMLMSDLLRNDGARLQLLRRRRGSACGCIIVFWGSEIRINSVIGCLLCFNQFNLLVSFWERNVCVGLHGMSYALSDILRLNRFSSFLIDLIWWTEFFNFVYLLFSDELNEAAAEIQCMDDILVALCTYKSLDLSFSSSLFIVLP